MIIKGRENVGLGQTFCPYQWLYIFIRARCHKALTSIKREKNIYILLCIYDLVVLVSSAIIFKWNY